jgi:hypothetical protein
MPEYMLDEWRAIACGRVAQPSDNYIVIGFPDDDVAQAYLSQASRWLEDEVRSILRTMVGSSRSVPLLDQLNVARLRHIQSTIPSDASVITRPRFSEYARRAILSVVGRSKEPTLEGLTWILDLLPRAPKKALDTISAYTVAHFEVLSDLRISGLVDASSLIRNRYILQGRSDLSAKIDVLLSLDWREFEYLIAKLYAAQDYDVEVTPAQKDRGKDIIAQGPNNELILLNARIGEARLTRRSWLRSRDEWK